MTYEKRTGISKSALFSVFPEVVIEGIFQDGMLHGEGSMRWPQGQRIDGTWDRGKLVDKRYTFADGLSYQEDGWNYCISPDRRFATFILSETSK